MGIMTLVTFVFMASLLVMSPGPNGVLIAKTVPTSGRQAGFANIWGFVAAFYIHGTLSIFGISVLLVHSAQAFFIVKLLGAGYLCWPFSRNSSLLTGASPKPTYWFRCMP